VRKEYHIWKYSERSILQMQNITLIFNFNIKEISF